MCLTCYPKHPIIRGKEDLEKVFYPILPKELRKLKQLGYSGNYLHTYNGGEIQLTHKQIDEIISHALCIIATGVDNRIDVWAIQWPREYKVLTL